MGAYLKENYLFQPHPLSVGWKSKRKKTSHQAGFFLYTHILFSPSRKEEEETNKKNLHFENRRKKCFFLRKFEKREKSRLVGKCYQQQRKKVFILEKPRVENENFPFLGKWK